MPLLCLILSAWAAEPRVILSDAGRADPSARPVLVVVTPGVPVSAYLPWIRAIEDAGLDAWTVHAPSRGQGVDELVEGIAAAHARLSEQRGEVALAAHGYGGVLALMAEPHAARVALVAVPLAPHPVPVQVEVDGSPVAERLPWDPALLGDMPAEPYSGLLAQAYAGWASELPPLAPPGCPSLLVASTADPVAPPELVRLPSLGWEDRTWLRRGPLSLEETEDPSHADLLLAPEAARELARFLAQGGWG
ncbi:MAG: hypothetical protein H6741_09295 [Alphaproteobacteria bacterium]|nr:hypothetical protein [Alphaproteobacteria bacterium]MCB9792909.1 hypothetical protein [Alphaproteobacteria bacterium]